MPFRALAHVCGPAIAISGVLAMATPVTAQTTNPTPLPPERAVVTMSGPAQETADHKDPATSPRKTSYKKEAMTQTLDHAKLIHDHRLAHRGARHHGIVHHYAWRREPYLPWGRQVAERLCVSLACPDFILLGVGY